MRRTKKEQIIDIINYVIVFGIYEIVRVVPLCFQPVISRIMGTLVCSLSPGLRAKITNNLDTAYNGEMSIENKNILVKKIISETFLNAFEIAYWMGKPIEKLEPFLEIEGIETLEKLAKSGKPAVAISGHMGNFVMMLGYLVIKNPQLTWIAKDANNLYLARLLIRLRKKRGIYAIHKLNMKEALVLAQKWLRNNHILCLVIDQHSGEGAEVQLFGKKVFAPLGANILARKFNCPVIGIFIHRTHGFRHKIIIEGPYNTQKTGNIENDSRANTQIFYDRIENYVRQNPQQWFTWLHKRFR